MEYIVRQIKKSDNKTLAEVIRGAFIEFDAPLTGTVYSDPTTDALFELFDKTDKSVCFVAELNNQVVGCCGIYPTKGLPQGYAELVKFYLFSGAREKGIGKALFEKSIQAAIEMNYEYLYIESQPSFAKALKMYEKYNFTYLKESMGDSGHDNCDVWMIKKLK